MRVKFDLDRVSSSQLNELLETFPKMKIKVLAYTVKSDISTTKRRLKKSLFKK
jgi:hypothetical protein